MATKALPLEELKSTTISDLFAFSGSKLVDQNEWVNQQKDEICRFPSDTLHKQGPLVQNMVEVFSKTDKKDKTKAICTLAGRLWFAHDRVYEDLIDKRLNLAEANTKLADLEEELLSVLAEKCQLDEQVAQLQRDVANGVLVPSGEGMNGKANERHDDMLQLIKELERAREEIDVSHAQIDNLRKLNKRQVDTLYELQTQARENHRKCETHQKEIHDLEAALRKRVTQNPPGCDGSCRDRIGQLENHIWEKEEEITSLKNQVNVEADRYWDAHNAVYDREVSIEQRENQITGLRKENDTLARQVRENQDKITELQARLVKDGNRRVIDRFPPTPGTSRTREESESEERTDSSEPRHEKRVPRKSRRDGQGGKQRRRTFFQPYPSSEDKDSDSGSPEMPRLKSKTKKNERRNQGRTGGEALPHPSAKTIKDIKGMLPSFSKNDKTTSILEHLSVYQRLMETLDMDSDVELRTYLSWTFAPDSQSFFLCVDGKNYETWAEFRCEVIKHFSPHRNSHEALRHALNLKCDFNQHPRDYLQMLKNAFAQVQKVVSTETKQFKDAYFYGLPKHIRTQLARDYNEDRSIDWIYKQAKSIYDVSRTEESEAKDKPKTSKICEVSKEKELPFEAGGNKPRPAPKEKERKKSPERKARSAPAKEPEASVGISPRYKGNRPIYNYVHRNKEIPGDEGACADRDRPRESERIEREPYRPRENERSDREPYRPREREGSNPNTLWQKGYGRSDYSPRRSGSYDYREREEERPHSGHQDRRQQWDERPRSPRPPQFLNALEERLKDLTNHCQRMINKDSGPSPRANTSSASEPKDRETKQPGQ